MEAAASAHPELKSLQGRGGVHVVPAPSGTGRWVIRHYHRGGAVAPLLGDRYLRVGEPRPFREFRLGRRLEAMGVPVPAHVGAAVYVDGPWYRGDLVTELVPGSRDLASLLFAGESLAGSERRARHAEAAMEAAGRLVRRLHDRGLIHRDLNLKNILVASGSGAGDDVAALILDLDRATIRSRVRARSRRRMLGRFWRSARKFEAATGRTLGPELRRAFEAGYG